MSSSSNLIMDAKSFARNYTYMHIAQIAMSMANLIVVPHVQYLHANCSPNINVQTTDVRDVCTQEQQKNIYNNLSQITAIS